MDKPPPARGRANLASCLIATAVLVLAAAVTLVVVFVLFRPRDPKVAVKAVQLPSFTVANGAVNLTLALYASLQNPNRDAFSHYRSTLQIYYAGSRVGFMFVPAGKVDGGRTVYMSATFPVDPFPFSPSSFPAALAASAGGFRYESMEIETQVRMQGTVRVLRFFTHRAEARAGCLIAIDVGGGSVLGFHC